MNIVIFGKGFGRPRQISLSGTTAVAVAVLAAGLLMSPAVVGPAWDEALRADRPCVLDVKTDPKVPPLPPHITYEQARKYATAIAKGDPEATGIVWQSIKQGLQGVLPRLGG